MAKYYNQPAPLTFDFSGDTPTYTTDQIPHSNDVITNHNLLKDDLFNVIETAIINIRKAIWGVEVSNNQLSNKEGDTILDLIETLYDINSSQITSQFYYQILRYLSSDSGVYHTYGYTPIDSENVTDIFRSTRYDITLSTTSVSIAPGTYLIRNRLVLPNASASEFSVNDTSLFGNPPTYTGNVYIYVKSEFSESGPANEGQIVLSTSPLSDDGDTWYIHLYTIQRIFSDPDYIFDINNVQDYRTFIPEYKYEFLYRTHNSVFDGYGDLPELTGITTSPIELTYVDNKYKFNLKYDSDDFELDGDGSLKIKSIDASLVSSVMSDILYGNDFVFTDSKWHINVSSDLVSDVGGLKLNDSVIKYNHIYSGLLGNCIYIDTNNKLSVNYDYPIDVSNNKLVLSYNTDMFSTSGNRLILSINSNFFEFSSGLSIKDNSITLSKLKKGTGSTDIKVDSDGYAVFK